MPREAESLDDWFIRAVLPHEAALACYLRTHWRKQPTEVNDLCQEALTRIYAAAGESRPARVKSYLFTTARRLIYDQIRRAQVVQIENVLDFESLNVPALDAGPEEQLSASQELRSLQRALARLPQKCRKVIELRRIHGLSQRETAARLGISEGAVEGRIQRGIRALAEALRDGTAAAGTEVESRADRAAEREVEL